MTFAAIAATVVILNTYKLTGDIKNLKRQLMDDKSPVIIDFYRQRMARELLKNEYEVVEDIMTEE